MTNHSTSRGWWETNATRTRRTDQSSRAATAVELLTEVQRTASEIGRDGSRLMETPEGCGMRVSPLQAERVVGKQWRAASRRRP